MCTAAQMCAANAVVLHRLRHLHVPSVLSSTMTLIIGGGEWGGWVGEVDAHLGPRAPRALILSVNH